MAKKSKQRKVSQRDLQAINAVIRPNQEPRFVRDYRSRGMYKTLKVEGFRSFETLALTDLSRVNIFFGPNNSGKSSILESVYLHASGFNLTPFLSQVLLRRSNNQVNGPLDAGEKLISLFHSPLEIPYNLRISARMDIGAADVSILYRPSAELADLDPRVLGQGAASVPVAERPTFTNQWQIPAASGALFSEPSAQPSISAGSLRLRTVPLGRWTVKLNTDKRDFDLSFPFEFLTEEPFKLAIFSDILTHRLPDSDVRLFSYLKRYGELEEFTQELAKSFDNVKGIDMIPYPDGTNSPMSIITGDGRWIPSYAFGDGMRRWYYLLGQLMVWRNSVHCIEEIDATLHPAAHASFSRALVSYAERFGCQLFLTTHSIEFADTFLNALYSEDGSISADADDPVRIFTLRPTSDRGRPEVWPLTGREAYSKRINYDLDLR